MAIQLTSFSDSMLIGLHAHSHNSSGPNDLDVKLSASKWSIDQSAEPVGRWDVLQQTVWSWQAGNAMHSFTDEKCCPD